MGGHSSKGTQIVVGIKTPRMLSGGELIDIDNEMYTMPKTNGTNSQPKSFQQSKLEMLLNLLPTLQSWNLQRLQPQNLIPFLGKRTPTCQSLKASYLKKKSRITCVSFD